MGEREELLAERADLMAKNAAATSWGAAVGARNERVKGIDRALQRLDESSAHAQGPLPSLVTQDDGSGDVIMPWQPGAEAVYPTRAPEAADAGAVDRAVAAYNHVWETAGHIDADNVAEVRRRAVEAALAAAPATKPASDAGMRERAAGAREMRERAIALVEQLYWKNERIHPMQIRHALQDLQTSTDVTSTDGKSPALNWKLSDDAKARIAEIESYIVKPGDPRLDQIVGGPQPRTTLSIPPHDAKGGVA